VVPTLNAAAGLARLLPLLRQAAMPIEIIVADGGSTDATQATAKAFEAKWIASPRGRGVQLMAGAGAGSGGWLLFLHADSQPEEGWEAAVERFCRHPQVASRAGYFDLALDDPSPAARRLERIVAWRCRWLGLPYGDQGLLISRRLYDAVGGYAALPLMEDVDLVRRLGRDRLARIGARCLTSAARYRRDGYWRRPLRNLCCLTLYFAGLPPQRIARLYG
jgi:rSAM/selenodomain-associated transferase 2